MSTFEMLDNDPSAVLRFIGIVVWWASGCSPTSTSFVLAVTGLVDHTAGLLIAAS